MAPTPSDAPAPSPARPDDSGTSPRVVRASVIVGACETPYLRLGRGGPALFLALTIASGDGAPPAARDAAAVAEWALVTTLAMHRRVTVVEPPTFDHERSFDRWLAGLLDGLGIARALVVVPERLALRGLHFALEHGERVERLVLVSDVSPHIAPPIVGTVGAAPSVPVLIVRASGDRCQESQEYAITTFALGDGSEASEASERAG